jgi:hypothetical protein
MSRMKRSHIGVLRRLDDASRVRSCKEREERHGIAPSRSAAATYGHVACESSQANRFRERAGEHQSCAIRGTSPVFVFNPPDSPDRPVIVGVNS